MKIRSQSKNIAMTMGIVPCTQDIEEGKQIFSDMRY